MKTKATLFVSLILFCCIHMFGQHVNRHKDTFDTISVSLFESEEHIVYRTMNYEMVQLPLCFDSVTIAYGVLYSKELYGCADDFWKGYDCIPTKEGEKARRWKEERLSEEEICNIERYICSAETYKNTQSALDGVDIFLYYHKNEEIIYRIVISSITRDIVFSQGGWIINNSINKEFECYLTKLLHDRNIWSEYERFADFD